MTKPRNSEVQTCFDPATQEMRVFCNSQLDGYFAGVRDELGQVERLVGDAVGDLVASFKYISKLVRSQQEISLSIVQTATGAPGSSNGESVEHLLGRQKAIIDQIEQEVDAAVTCMQFGDLATQLLSHTMIRIEALGTALQRVGAQDVTASGAPGYKPCRFHEMVTEAVTAANAVTREKPVGQQGMHAGAIDLF